MSTSDTSDPQFESHNQQSCLTNCLLKEVGMVQSKSFWKIEI